MTDETNNASGPVAWQFYQHGEWHNGSERIKDHRTNTEAAGIPVRDLYTAPPATNQGTTSDKYRAELYDEVWQRARDMGFENVTMALAELAALKAVPDGVEVVGWLGGNGLRNNFESATGSPFALMTVAQHNARMAEKDAQIEALAIHHRQFQVKASLRQRVAGQDISALVEALELYSLPLTGDDRVDAAEFGPVAVSREMKRRAALAAHKAGGV